MKLVKEDYKALGMVILGLIFVSIGWMQRENAEVLLKAINICLECIGIG